MQTVPVAFAMQETTKCEFRLRVGRPDSFHQLAPATFIQDVRHRVPG